MFFRLELDVLMNCVVIVFNIEIQSLDNETTLKLKVSVSLSLRTVFVFIRANGTYQ